ncbi:hypothetical protein [Jiangella asiatica]|uniref:hypothetical protein n=1 Tax=Jiangella asiatica TaxID=2530372 RepID=UPI0013A5BFF3|nr:hypothetical protein [Jiangella asiatica]
MSSAARNTSSSTVSRMIGSRTDQGCRVGRFVDIVGQADHEALDQQHVERVRTGRQPHRPVRSAWFQAVERFAQSTPPGQNDR